MHIMAQFTCTYVSNEPIYHFTGVIGNGSVKGLATKYVVKTHVTCFVKVGLG